MSRPRAWLGLGAAVAAAVALIAVPRASRPADPPAMAPLTQVWPGAVIGEVPALLPDSTIYSPLAFIDAATSVGTAPSRDGTQLRLVLRSAGPAGAPPAVRTLRSLPFDASPQFAGFAAEGDTLAWAESSTDRAGRMVNRLFAVDWRAGGPPRQLTSRAGDLAFVNSGYDLVIAADRVHWVAVAPTAEPVTELRSVALAGGPVSTRRVTGAWIRSAWPWLVGAGTAGSVRLRDQETGSTVEVPAGQTELVACGPAWCRVLVLAGDAPARTDLMRTDGSDRRTVAGRMVTAALVDVALLDRFEPLTRAGTGPTPTSRQELLLYDLRERRLVAVANGVGMVLGRAGLIWWSTEDPSAGYAPGTGEDVTWWVLDLRTLD